jgi:CheY-like chemotaxis protein/HPt (histidine-containing phosphotransfer) domain-containing protein
MHGNIWAESVLGNGTCFHFTLVVQAAALATNTNIRSIDTTLIGKRVLVVEDNLVCRDLLCRWLDLWAFVCDSVTTTKEALDKILKNNYDIILLDAQPPEIDIDLFISKILNKLPNIKLISLSPLGKQNTIPGFHAQIFKPIKPLSLLKILSDIYKTSNNVISKEAKTGSFSNELPLRILVAEDNPINQKVILGMLNNFGYRADVAANGLEVLEALNRQFYDLIFMDIQMPEMDGLEATCEIYKKFPPNKLPYIIAITANATTQDKEHCLAVGMNDYVPKPIRIEQLKAAINRYKEKYKTASPSKTSNKNNSFEQDPLLVVKQKNQALQLQEKDNSMSPIDLTVLQSFKKLKGGEILLKELIKIFLSDAPQKILFIKEALDNKDFSNAERTAHSLKSSSGSLGAKHFSELCGDVEKFARNKELSYLVASFEQLEVESKSVFSFLLEKSNIL